MAKTFVELIEQVKGILGVGNGGTGKSSNTINSLLVGNGTSPIQEIPPGSSGQVLTVVSGVWAPATGAVANYFSVDGGSSSTSYVGVLKIDAGGSV